MPRPVEAARGEDVRAGPGEGRDPHEGALVSGLTETSRALSDSLINTPPLTEPALLYTPH